MISDNGIERFQVCCFHQRTANKKGNTNWFHMLIDNLVKKSENMGGQLAYVAWMIEKDLVAFYFSLSKLTSKYGVKLNYGVLLHHSSTSIQYIQKNTEERVGVMRSSPPPVSSSKRQYKGLIISIQPIIHTHMHQPIT